ncbi:hypothetical protein ACGFW5_01875 [Streptomyces sp. NPDC048416]|uniref:hypothetical protein n=1 Tax=Streptomyces sp. NPDC048416 TaxID=3365546 RepID=UPI0037119B27
MCLLISCLMTCGNALVRCYRFFRPGGTGIPLIDGMYAGDERELKRSKAAMSDPRNAQIGSLERHGMCHEGEARGE